MMRTFLSHKRSISATKLSLHDRHKVRRLVDEISAHFVPYHGWSRTFYVVDENSLAYDLWLSEPPVAHTTITVLPGVSRDDLTRKLTTLLLGA